MMRRMILEVGRVVRGWAELCVCLFVGSLSSHVVVD